MDVSVSNKHGDLDLVFVPPKKVKKNHVLKQLGDSFKFMLIYNTVHISTKGIKTEDDWRELGFGLINYLNGLAVKSATVAEENIPKYPGAFIEGLLLGDYSFDLYKSKPKKNALKHIYFDTGANFETILEKAKIRAESQNLTREMVNGSPEDMNSRSIEKYMRELTHAFNKGGDKFNVKFYKQWDLDALGMNGHLAVNRASRHEPMTIKIEYIPADWDKHVVLVGKGLTYDSGGLDVKTAGHMQNMKCDKAGAMTVLGIMRGIAELNSDKKITAYLGIAENMIDGSAYKADDVLTMKNGTTVHVRNTDAEGRIVLFDNLCLAEEENPDFDEIYTFATLTGAAVFQFGNEACGMVGFNDKMKKKIKKVGKVEGEVFCNAEFHKFMMDGVDDDVADVSNTGTPNQGCQKAGLFLTHALTEKAKKRYLHLDIAGPAFAKSAFGTNKKGGTGFAVRTFLNYLAK